MPELPQFIEPLQVELEEEDMDYLALKHAFELPEPEPRSALLCAFFDYIHPLLPILDLDSFLLAVSGKGERGERASLVVFQAVLAAATCHVDMDYLRGLGFLTREEARNTLFGRARVCEIGPL